MWLLFTVRHRFSNSRKSQEAVNYEEEVIDGSVWYYRALTELKFGGNVDVYIVLKRTYELTKGEIIFCEVKFERVYSFLFICFFTIAPICTCVRMRVSTCIVLTFYIC